jgi:hypothetical protein
MGAISKVSASNPNACRVETCNRVCWGDVNRASTTYKLRRARRADMSRTAFMGLVAGWTGGLVLVLFFSILARNVSLDIRSIYQLGQGHDRLFLQRVQ